MAAKNKIPPSRLTPTSFANKYRQDIETRYSPTQPRSKQPTQTESSYAQVNQELSQSVLNGFSRGEPMAQTPSQREQAVAVSTWRDMRSKFSDEMEKGMLDGTYDNDTFKNVDRLEQRRQKSASVEEARDDRRQERQFDRELRSYRIQTSDANNRNNMEMNNALTEAQNQRAYGASEAGRDRYQQRQGWDAQLQGQREGRAENENRDQLNFAARMAELAGGERASGRASSNASAEADKDRAQRTMELSMQLDDNKYHTFMRSAKGDAGRYW